MRRQRCCPAAQLSCTRGYSHRGSMEPKEASNHSSKLPDRGQEVRGQAVPGREHAAGRGRGPGIRRS